MGKLGRDIFVRLMIMIFVMCFIMLFIVEFKSAEFIALVVSMTLNVLAIVTVIVIREYKKRNEKKHKNDLAKIIVITIAFQMTLSVGGNFSMNKVQAEKTGGYEPVIAETKYDSHHIVIADITITKDYKADNTGREDCTSIIKEAISFLKQKGGGTIYFPEGKYRVTSSIDIPNYITLRGDWCDPDLAKNGEYGTVIYADVPSTTEALPGLFRLSGSAGLVGMTIYYPGQIMSAIKPYPYTFEIMGGAFGATDHMLQTIQNVTLLNSYKGVAASRTVNPQVEIGQRDAHENLLIENLKGTVLKEGINAVNESDIGYYKNIFFNAGYWANSGAAYNAPANEEITRYTRENGAGLILGDLEWSPYYNIRVDGYKTGVQIIKGTRIQPENPIAFMGGFYHLDVTNCQYGLQVEDLYKNWGMLVTKSSISGSVAAVANIAKEGYVRLTDVKIDGKIAGERIFKSDLAVPEIETDTPVIASPKKVLYDVVKSYQVINDGRTECASQIQKALNEAGQNGGGVVYLRAGYYKISTPLAIPDGVELRGCCESANRDTVGNSAGTIIFSYYGEGVSEPKTANAFITMGKKSGLSGLRIVYPNNNPAFSLKEYPYAVRMKGDNSYITNVGAVGWYYGVEIKNSKNCVIKNMPALFYKTGIHVDHSSNCFIENVFSNATIATRMGLQAKFQDVFEKWTWQGDNSLWNYYKITHENTTLVQCDNAQNINIMSVFTFASNTILRASDSTGLVLMGCGGDNMYKNGVIANLNHTSLDIVNLLKFVCPTKITAGDCNVNIYGRMALRLGGVDNENDDNMLANVLQPYQSLLSNTTVQNVTYSDDAAYVEKKFTYNPLTDMINSSK